jgi:lysophospholipase L1-like esterase
MRSAVRLLPALAGALLMAGLAGCSPQAPASPAASSAPAATGTPTPTTTPTPAASARPGDAPTTTIAALGDSLSRGFDACDHYGDCPSVSWSTGTNATVDSIASRLRQQTGGRVVTRNNAESGVSVDDLPRQVDLAIDQQPDLVTVLIGANDVCRTELAAMTPAGVYSRTVDEQLQRLAAALPNARILVASVPDVTNLLPVAGADSTARFLWSNLGGCSTVLADPQSTSPAAVQRRLAVRERIDEYNSALASSCSTIARCVWDGGDLNRYQPTVAQLSPLDYFHPSVAGLRELAAVEWRALGSAGG